ncbi:hypothetical protein ES705_26714 [subsurface metagenome]
MGGRRQRKLNLRGDVFIIGEGITEQYYFTHIKHLKKYKCVVKPRFFGKTDITQIDKIIEKLLLGGINVICVFDADVSERNTAEKEKLNQFRLKYQKNSDVLICDSLPSIEFWFLLHYIKTNKHFSHSKAVMKELNKFISDYVKTENYLINNRWVEQLMERLDTACRNAKSLEQCEGSSYSNIYKAIDKLEGK